MLSKTEINANKTVIAFLKEELGLDYNDKFFENRNKFTITGQYSDGEKVNVNFFRRSGRGDKMISIQKLKQYAKAGDKIRLSFNDEETRIYILLEHLLAHVDEGEHDETNSWRVQAIRRGARRSENQWYGKYQGRSCHEGIAISGSLEDGEILLSRMDWKKGPLGRWYHQDNLACDHIMSWDVSCFRSDEEENNHG